MSKTGSSLLATSSVVFHDPLSTRLSRYLNGGSLIRCPQSAGLFEKLLLDGLSQAGCRGSHP